MGWPSSAINDGYSIRASEVLGADFAYMGTRFIATEEAEVDPDYKQMLIDAEISDLIYTKHFTGVNCNYLKPSIQKAGIDFDQFEGKKNVDMDLGDSNAWKDIWSAGHGVAGIHQVEKMKDLVDHLAKEYQEARDPLKKSLAWKGTLLFSITTNGPSQKVNEQ